MDQASSRMFWQWRNARRLRHPDWAVESGPGDYVHALVTHARALEIDARIGPADVPGSEIILLPADWEWTRYSRRRSLVKPGDIIMSV